MYAGNRAGEKVIPQTMMMQLRLEPGCAGKHGGVHWQSDASAGTISEKRKYKVSDMNVDDEYDHDIVLKCTKQKNKMSLAKQQKAKQNLFEILNRVSVFTEVFILKTHQICLETCE